LENVEIKLLGDIKLGSGVIERSEFIANAFKARDLIKKKRVKEGCRANVNLLI